MKKINFTYKLLVTVLCALYSCNKLDNYDEPDAGIIGSVIDSVSHQTVLTEQPNGIRIRLIELNDAYPDPLPYDVWSKADGTFESSKVFSGKYKVVAMEGAFFPVDTQTVVIEGRTEINFTVVPFLNVSTTKITPEPGKVTVEYQISRIRAGAKIQEAKIWASSVPTVSNAKFDAGLVATRNLSGVADQTILTSTYSNTITGLISGKKYYIRVGARTNTSPTRFNYTSTFEVDIP